MSTLGEVLDQAIHHHQAGRLAAAEAIYRQILSVQPRHDEALYLLGRIEQDRGRFELAEQYFSQAIAVDGTSATCHHNLGKVLETQRRYAPAIAAYREAIRLQADYALAYNSLAGALYATGALAEAEAAYRQALHCQPDFVGAYNNLGVFLRDQKRLAEARECYQAALRLNPRLVEAQNNLGNVLREEGRLDDAIEVYEQAVRLDLNYAPAHFNLAIALKQSGRTAEAMAAFEKVLQLEPGNADAFARLVWTRQQICDWRTYDADLERLWADAERLLMANQPTGVAPFQALTLPRSQLLAVARSHSAAAARQQAAEAVVFRARSLPAPTGRLKVGYLSGDFYDHPIGHLLAGFFGRHQRDAFEVFAYSFGPADESSYRQRIMAESEHFVEVGSMSHRGLAQRMVDDGIQILIDLMGYTGIHRVEVLAMRPAPIQVSFLGMLGTMGADFIDYLITDRVVTPPEFAPEFTERFVTMPDSYLIAEPEPEPEIPHVELRRADHGLPDESFVYCSFNSSYKIEPRTFDVWMRILAQVPESVLWLYSADSLCESNLRREAAARGISPERLVFGPFLSRPQHLLRHRLADLFLDTLQYNAAGTASLALQMGLPVLACRGETFAARVGASLLTTAGLTELIADNADHYERLAVELGRQPERLRPLRARLASGRTTSPLFDVGRFVGHLEAAYRTMWQRFVAGQPPQAIDVADTNR